MDNSNPSETKKIEQLLEAGQIAKLKIYQNLLKRVAEGEKLSPTDLRTLTALEAEFESQLNDSTERPPEVIGSFDKAAEYCGVSKRTISYHVKKGNIKQERDGSFFKSELDKYLTKYGRNKKDSDVDPDEIKRAELKYRIARARREELLVSQLEGQLIALQEVERAFTARAYELARSLLLLSRRVAHRVAAACEKQTKEVVIIIDEEVNQFLNGYSRPAEIGSKQILK